MGDELDFHSWELLSAYLDGALDEIATAMVERAVRYDPELENSLETLRRQKAALKNWAAQLDARPLPPGVRAVMERARRERDGRDDPRAREKPGKE